MNPTGTAFGAQRNPWASKNVAEIQHAKLQKMWVMEDDYMLMW